MEMGLANCLRVARFLGHHGKHKCDLYEYLFSSLGRKGHNILFISLPLEKSGFWLSSVSGSRRNRIKNRLSDSLGYSLFCKKWDWWEKLFVTLRAHMGQPSSECSWLLGR